MKLKKKGRCLMDFMTSQPVLMAFTRRLKEWKAHWKTQLNPYLQLKVEGRELIVYSALMDETTVGVWRFELDDVSVEGTALIALEDWLQLNVRWKRTGMVRITVQYPELLLTTLEGQTFRVPTQSFYFPTIPTCPTFKGSISAQAWQLVVTDLYRTLSNQHPLKEYEYVWLKEQMGELLLQSATETEWTVGQLSVNSLPPTVDSTLIHAFSRTQWFALKQASDSLKSEEAIGIRFAWDEDFIWVEVGSQQFVFKRERGIPSYVMNETHWQPNFQWITIEVSTWLDEMNRYAVRCQTEAGGKLPKGLMISISDTGELFDSMGWQLPYRSLVQFLKDHPTTKMEFGVSKIASTTALVAFQLKTSHSTVKRWFVSRPSN